MTELRTTNSADGGKLTLVKREGSRLPSATLQKGLPVLIQLAREGKGTAEALVEASKAEGTPFHQLLRFGEPDAELAHEWRLGMARQVWSSVEVQYEDSRGDKQRSRAFVSVDVGPGEGGGRQYVPLPEAAKSYRDQIITKAKEDLAGFNRRNSVLKQLLSREEVVGLFESEFFG